LHFFFSTIFTYSIKAYAIPDISRIEGSDRYETSIEISRSGWAYGSSEYAVLATGEDFPDALCAAPLAKKLNAPILLADGYELSSGMETELGRLGVKYVYIIGGISAISPYIQEQIEAKGIRCIRIAGSDRYETQIEIAKLLGNFDQVVVAEENNFADLLSIAPIAAQRGMPVMLSPKEALPNSIDQYLRDDITAMEMKEWDSILVKTPERLTRDEKAAWLSNLTGVALGSDAFFPFRDNIDRAAQSGVKYIVQAGGSIRDDIVIEACNEYDIAMVCSGIRLFHH
jgi:putative cell wall-binding protein